MTQTERVLEAVRDHGPLKAGDVADLVEEHIKRESCSAVLSALTAKGSLMRLEDGRYTLGDGTPVQTKAEPVVKPTASVAPAVVKRETPASVAVTTGTESTYVELPEPLKGAAVAFARAQAAPAAPKVTQAVREGVLEEYCAQIGGMRIVITGTSPFLAHKALAAALQAML